MGTPYSGNPANFVDAVTELDGSDAPNSTNINTAPEGIADRTAFLFKNAFAAGGGNNWDPPALADPTNTFVQNIGRGSVEWDDENGQWMMPAVDGTTSANIYFSYDGRDTWTTLSPALALSGVAISTCTAGVDPNGTQWYLGFVASSSGGISIRQFIPGVGARWSDSYDESGSAPYTDLQCSNFGGYAIFAAGNATNTAGVNFITSNDAFATSGTVTNVGGAVGTVPQWLLRHNDAAGPLTPGTPIFIAAPINAAYATPFLYTSTDGHTFTLQTAGFGGNLLPNDQIRGLDWGQDGTGPCWIMAVLTVSSTVKFLRSSDGINWTLVTTLTLGGSSAPPDSLAASGRLWVLSFGPSTVSPKSIAYSGDTKTWFLAHARMAQGSGGAVTLARSNGLDQVCVSNRYGARFSHAVNPFVGPLP